MTEYEERNIAALQQIGYQLESQRKQLYDVIQQRTDELEAKNEEIKYYRAKIHAYEQRLKELTEGPEPAKEIYRGMEVSQFGAK